MVIADDLTGACDAGVAFAPNTAVVLKEPHPATETIVYTTDSRADSPEAAAGKIAALVRRLPDHTLLFKKVDSVLRGNIRAELDALAAAGLRTAIACTAFPDQQRYVRRGVAFPPGRPLADVVPPWVEIADAGTDADLDRIATTVLDRSPTPVAIGSAGLARAVARRLGIAPVLPEPPPGGVAVIVIGSTHQATRAQVNHLQVHPDTRFLLHEIAMPNPSPSQIERIRRDLVAQRNGGLIVSGGDTARLLLDILDAGCLRLLGEFAPGIPVGRIEGGPAAGLTVITKSGGFGSEDALSCAADFLCNQNRKT
ncbi:MAG: four-carbon acid sugar kinase family protein [Bryobacteraceae bacterium]